MGKIVTLVLWLPLCIAACAMNHHPQLVARKIPAEQLRADTVHGPIAIINDCREKGDIEFCRLEAVHHFWSDFYTVTDVAKEILSDALLKMGAEVDEKARKKIKLSVHSVSCREGSVLFEITVVLAVQLNDGPPFQFTDSKKFGNASAVTPSFELAIRECINKMLGNDSVASFLASD